MFAHVIDIISVACRAVVVDSLPCFLPPSLSHVHSAELLLRQVELDQALVLWHQGLPALVHAARLDILVLDLVDVLLTLQPQQPRPLHLVLCLLPHEDWAPLLGLGPPQLPVNAVPALFQALAAANNLHAVGIGNCLLLPTLSLRLRCSLLTTAASYCPLRY